MIVVDRLGVPIEVGDLVVYNGKYGLACRAEVVQVKKQIKIKQLGASDAFLPFWVYGTSCFAVKEFKAWQ